MNKEEFVTIICDNLNLDRNKIVVLGLTYGRILEAIFVGKTIPGTAEELGIAHRRVNILLNEEAFPMVEKAFAKPWRTRLLEKVGYKTCRTCKSIKPLSEFFNKNNNGIANRSNKSYICKDCDKKVTRNKYKNSPHIHRAANNKHKALTLDPTSMVGANEDVIKYIYKYCPEGYQVDHIIPLAKGGKHHEKNLCYLPIKLNNQKGARLPEEVQEIMDHAIYPDLSIFNY